eukprot:CAMPEP_0118972608 /NCGR_PEP_ID=MMETSP1173-20130426/8872_1 /TAXON_ID=1034831 /ORGANISM="Rhizochromulina marina cf, Strain CCMP1243" /LENGTH=261 /DNA_ID=CAMNT_0006922171 /DNA_START=6 /DNA_END=788 /DNA_ORIENTATION=-
MEARCAELSELKYQHETTIRDQEGRLSSLELAHGEAQRELSNLRAQNQHLETRKFELEKEVQKHQLRNTAFEQQVLDKEQLVQNAVDLHKATQAAQQRAEESLQLHKANTVTLQEKLKSSIAEINRGNDIIRRLQADMKTMRERVREKSEVIREQERVLDLERESKKGVEAAQHKMSLDSQHDKERIERLEVDLREAHRKLDESTRLLESNQQTIAWLNKELNATTTAGAIGSAPGTFTAAAIDFQAHSVPTGGYMAWDRR